MKDVAKERDQQLKSTQAELDQLHGEIANLKKTHESELKSLREQFEGNQQEATETLRRRLEQEKALLTKDYEAQLAALRNRLEQQISELKGNYEKMMQSQGQSSQKELLQLKQQLERLQNELAAKQRSILELEEQHKNVAYLINNIGRRWRR